MAIGGFLFSTRTDARFATGLIHQMARTLCHAHDQSMQTWENAGLSAGLCEVASSVLAERRPTIAINMSGRRAVVLAGQIDNDPLERRRLVAGAAEDFDTRSDEEFVLQLCSLKGLDGFKDLKGSFAIALYDETSGSPQLVLVSDRWSSWPLFYALTDNGDVVFATEVHAMCAGLKKRQLNMAGVMEFFAFQRVYGEKTLLENVFWLTPCTTLLIQDGKVRKQTYGEIRYRHENRTFQDHVEELAQTLQRSVARRMKPNGQNGLLLSGGLDSRMVLAAAPEGMKCFTFGDYKNPEYGVAARVAEAARTPIYFLQRDPNHYVNMINDAVLLGNGMHAFNHAHGLGFLEKIKGEFGCEILFHGYGIERLFRGSSLPRVFKSIGPLNIPVGVRPICSAKALENVILARTYNIVNREPWRLFRKPFGSMYREVIEQTASDVTREALECGGTLQDAYIWPDVYYHSRSPSFLFVTSMRPWVDEQCLVFDSDLFDLHLRIPSRFRGGNKLWLSAMRRLSPAIAGVTDANTGCRPSLPVWVQQVYKSRTQLLSRLPGAWRFTSSKENQPKGGSPISWPRFDWMIAHNPAMRRLVDEVIHDPQAVNPDLFDIDGIRQIVTDHVEGKELNRFLIFLVLTFGIWHKHTLAAADQGDFLSHAAAS